PPYPPRPSTIVPTGMDYEKAIQFVGGYFHQDCLVDDPDWYAVVVRFRDSSSPDDVRTTRGVLLNMIETWSDAKLDAFVAKHSQIDPGLTSRTWFESIVHILAGGERPPHGREEQE